MDKVYSFAWHIQAMRNKGEDFNADFCQLVVGLVGEDIDEVTNDKLQALWEELHFLREQAKRENRLLEFTLNWSKMVLIEQMHLHSWRTLRGKPFRG